MTAPIDLGLHVHTRATAAAVERLNALRPVALVRGHRHEVDVHLVHVDGNVSQALRSVGVKLRVVLPGNGANLLDGRDGPHLIVRHHDGDEYRIVPDRAAHLVGIDHAVFIDRQIGDLPASLPHLFAGIEDGLVLRLGR